MYPGCNVEIWLSNQDGKVPGSYRVGHNVFTDFGKNWLRDLVLLNSFGDAVDGTGSDTPRTTHRMRWVAVGGTSNFLELASVVALSSEAVITASDVRKELPAPTFPTNSSVRYAIAFAGAELPDPINVVEVGMFVDADEGVGPTHGPTVTGVSPVAYKSFPPLPTKTASETLNIVWEFRF